MNENISALKKAVEQNNMAFCYCENESEVREKVKEMLFNGCTITAGGSVSLKESGVWDILKSEKYAFFDRTDPNLTPEQKQNAFKEAIGCDFFFCSGNAITEKGELINVDGTSNRISSICFGPKNVVMIVGKNKLVKTVEEGLLRVKQVAAPKNAVRLGLNTPCAKLGKCVSLQNGETGITSGCFGDCRICSNYLISAHQSVKNRITVIFCNTNLGY